MNWMISFGISTPVIDKYKPRVRLHKSSYLTKSNATRKLLRGINACLKSGMLNSNEIYEVLSKRGFLNRLDGTVMAKRTLRLHVTTFRAKRGIVRKNKKTLISEMFLSGKSVSEITKSLNSTTRYVTQTLRKNANS